MPAVDNEQPPIASLAIVDMLLLNTITMVSRHGVDNISLRTISAQSGCSTAYIFQKFGNKDGLVRAALEQAVAMERNSHASLLETLSALPIGLVALADFVSHYVESRATQDVPRFMLSWLARHEAGEAITSSVAAWHEMRIAFWTAASRQCALPPQMAAILATYVAMEECYATALHGDLRYGLLLKETVRALLYRAAQDAGRADTSIAAALDVVPRPALPENVDKAGSIRDRLLHHAKQEILLNGIDALNQRTVARKAGASNSAISYHFGSMEAFVDEAIWRALLTDIPAELDPTKTIDGKAMRMEDWLGVLSHHLRRAEGGQPAGFYTTYARITAQTCLMVHGRPSLKPLVAFLRELDGWGTYRASRHLAPSILDIDRDQASAFAIWIKGLATVSAASAAPGKITWKDLGAGAAAILDAA